MPVISVKAVSPGWLSPCSHPRLQSASACLHAALCHPADPCGQQPKPALTEKGNLKLRDQGKHQGLPLSGRNFQVQAVFTVLVVLRLPHESSPPRGQKVGNRLYLPGKRAERSDREISSERTGWQQGSGKTLFLGAPLAVCKLKPFTSRCYCQGVGAAGGPGTGETEWPRRARRPGPAQLRTVGSRPGPKHRAYLGFSNCKEHSVLTSAKGFWEQAAVRSFGART